MTTRVKPQKEGLPAAVIQEHRQAPGDAQPALDKIDRPRQRELAGVAGDGGFLPLDRVLQQVEPDGLFVPGQGHDAS